MLRVKSQGIMLFLATILLLLIGACSSTDNPVTPETPLKPPTNLKAYSKDKDQVGITWSSSVDVNASNFGSYVLKVKTGGAVVAGPYYPTKSDSSYPVTGLTEGTIYDFVLSTKTSSGTVGDSNVVTWAPAKRVTGDASSLPLKLYEWKSALPSGLDLRNSGGNAEVVSMATSSTKKVEADVLLSYTVDGANLEFESPKIESTDFKSIKFSSTTYSAASLDDPRASFPSADSFTLIELIIPSTQTTNGMIAFAKTQEGNYCRIFILPSSNLLIQGSSPNRYVQVYISYQSVANVPFAKTSN